MASEPRRGCGFRKVGGLYLVAPGAGRPCCRLPIELHICPTCAQGVKPARGWSWVDLAPFARSACIRSLSGLSACPLEAPAGKVGLLWIGEQFYPSPAHFELEASSLGISRRVSRLPRGFVIGETWVALAHRRAVKAPDGYRAGIFRLFKPVRVELIVTASDFADVTKMDLLRARGVTPVAVDDADPDHRGSVFDDAAEVDQSAGAPE